MITSGVFGTYACSLLDLDSKMVWHWLSSWLFKDGILYICIFHSARSALFLFLTSLLVYLQSGNRSFSDFPHIECNSRGSRRCIRHILCTTGLKNNKFYFNIKFGKHIWPCAKINTTGHFRFIISLAVFVIQHISENCSKNNKC